MGKKFYLAIHHFDGPLCFLCGIVILFVTNEFHFMKCELTLDGPHNTKNDPN